MTGSAEKDGKIVQKYVNAKTLVKDVVFEETHDNSMKVKNDDYAKLGGLVKELGFLFVNQMLPLSAELAQPRCAATPIAALRP